MLQWAINKKHIDPVCPRYTAISTDARVLMRLSNGPAAPEAHPQPFHPKNADVGETLGKGLWGSTGRAVRIQVRLTPSTTTHPLSPSQARSPSSTVLQCGSSSKTWS